MSANPHANGGLLRRDLRMPDYRDYAIEVAAPGQTSAMNTRPLGAMLADIMSMKTVSINRKSVTGCGHTED